MSDRADGALPAGHTAQASAQPPLQRAAGEAALEIVAGDFRFSQLRMMHTSTRSVDGDAVHNFKIKCKNTRHSQKAAKVIITLTAAGDIAAFGATTHSCRVCKSSWSWTLASISAVSANSGAPTRTTTSSCTDRSTADIDAQHADLFQVDAAAESPAGDADGTHADLGHADDVADAPAGAADALHADLDDAGGVAESPAGAADALHADLDDADDVAEAPAGAADALHADLDDADDVAELPAGDADALHADLDYAEAADVEGPVYESSSVTDYSDDELDFVYPSPFTSAQHPTYQFRTMFGAEIPLYTPVRNPVHKTPEGKDIVFDETLTPEQYFHDTLVWSPRILYDEDLAVSADVDGVTFHIDPANLSLAVPHLKFVPVPHFPGLRFGRPPFSYCLGLGYSGQNTVVVCFQFDCAPTPLENKPTFARVLSTLLEQPRRYADYAVLGGKTRNLNAPLVAKLDDAVATVAEENTHIVDYFYYVTGLLGAKQPVEVYIGNPLEEAALTDAQLERRADLAYDGMVRVRVRVGLGLGF